jgi:hypothetical protein
MPSARHFGTENAPAEQKKDPHSQNRKGSFHASSWLAARTEKEARLLVARPGRRRQAKVLPAPLLAPARVDLAYALAAAPGRGPPPPPPPPASTPFNLAGLACAVLPSSQSVKPGNRETVRALECCLLFFPSFDEEECKGVVNAKAVGELASPCPSLTQTQHASSVTGASPSLSQTPHASIQEA